MADFNSVARQPRRNRSFGHNNPVFSFQPFSEQTSKPNHDQPKIEEAVEPTQTTGIHLNPPSLKHPRAAPSKNPDCIPLLKSGTLRQYTRERAIGGVKRWLESGSGSESGYRQQGYHHLDSSQNHATVTYSGNSPVPRKGTNTAPVEEDIQNTRKFARAPASTTIQSGWIGEDYHYDNYSDYYPGTRSATPENSSIFSTMLSTRSLVENPGYRLHLKQNGINLLPSYHHLPGHVSNFLGHIWKYRAPTGPSQNQIQSDTQLAELGMGASEGEIASYFQQQLFLLPGQKDGLKGSIKLPMARHAVPGVGSELRISIPVPDILYGYNLFGAFTDGEQTQIYHMATSPVFGNNDGLMFPFLAIEQKGDGPVSRGSLWVATNQCLGASASCVNIVERFNQLKRKCNPSSNNDNNSYGDNVDVKSVDSISFSIAMNGSEARLYVTWKQDEVTYHTAIVDSFLLQRPCDFLNFRRYVLNILDWGMDARLTGIKNSLGHLLGESKETASRQVKARLSPSTEEQDSGQARKRRCGNRRTGIGNTESSTDPLALSL
ncbi:hypothetical protein VE03_06022 [Pseudogymnoascus sp. 23342-1-I1]|nr:hypothetical protein VE03_06022 [Pseudogymnoascus sp. 23342-1-I1]